MGISQSYKVQESGRSESNRREGTTLRNTRHKEPVDLVTDRM